MLILPPAEDVEANRVNEIAASLSSETPFGNVQTGLILFFLAGWAGSVALMLANALLISSVLDHGRFKAANFSLWLAYVIPAIALCLGSIGVFNLASLTDRAEMFWTIYALAVPFITIGHSTFLFRNWRKARQGSALLQFQH